MVMLGYDFFLASPIHSKFVFCIFTNHGVVLCKDVVEHSI